MLATHPQPSVIWTYVTTPLTHLILVWVAPLHVILEERGIEEGFITMKALKEKQGKKICCQYRNVNIFGQRLQLKKTHV